MTQEPETDSEPPDQETVSFWKRFRLGASLMAIFVAIYLFFTGPLLWSCSRIQNRTWQGFVDLTMIPIMKLEYYNRHGNLQTYRPFNIDQSDEPWWVTGLKSYWNLYGAVNTYALMYHFYDMDRWAQDQDKIELSENRTDIDLLVPGRIPIM